MYVFEYVFNWNCRLSFVYLVEWKNIILFINFEEKLINFCKLKKNEQYFCGIYLGLKVRTAYNDKSTYW